MKRLSLKGLLQKRFEHPCKKWILSPRKSIMLIDIKKVKIYTTVILLFAMLSVLLTFPLIRHMVNGLFIGDPSLNTWILAWDVHSILTNPSNLFNANIFYPFTENTLAFSEHLFSNILISFPIIVMTHNPILAYNLIFLLSFILSGFGMFLLVNHYLNDKYSAFLAGIIFAFCTYRFAHLGHLQLLTAQWMPFSFLYLDKFLHKSTNKNLVLFSLFFILQVLSSWYYAVYITIALVLYFLYMLVSDYTIRKKIFSDTNFQFKVILFVVFSIIIILPFAQPYIQVSHEYGFTRHSTEVEYYSADVGDYFLTPPNNIIYGKISQPYHENRNWGEHSLFPGMGVIFLSLYGLLSIIKFKIGNSKKRGLIYTGGSMQNFYLFLAFFAFILTLGPHLNFFGHSIDITLPYTYFYEYLPGFGSMRAPSRFNIIVMLSLSVLAGYGLNKLIKSRRKTKKTLISVIFILIILSESLYVPVGIGITPVGEGIPEVYKWLANEKDDFAIVELPTGYFTPTGNNLWYDTKYMYYSTYHWKKLVNGYSGFFPPGYISILDHLQTFPSNDSINLLQQLGVKYVIIHSNEIDANRWYHIKNDIANYKDIINLVKIFGHDHVYQINLENTYRPSPISISSGVHIPSHMQKNDNYIGSIEINNNAEQDYIITKPSEKITLHIEIASKEGDKNEKVYQLPLQAIIKPNTRVDIPFTIDSPKSVGAYTVFITISDTMLGMVEPFEYNVVVVDELYDSVFSDDVHAEYNTYEIPTIIPAGEKFKVRLTATNIGTVLWRSKVSTREPIGEVHVGNRWFKDGNAVWKSERSLLPHDVAPGQNVTTEIELTAPELPGNYTLELDLVNEGITWFGWQGTETIKKNVVIL